MKNFLLFSLLLFASSSLNAQNIDSLKRQVLVATSAYDKAKLYIKIANNLEDSQVDSSRFYALKAVKVLKSLKGDSVLKLTSEAYNTLGICENNQGNYGNAINYFSTAARYDKQMEAFGKAAQKYVNIAIIYKNQGEHFRALQLYDSSMVHASTYSDTSFMASIYLNKGVLYYELGNYDQALAFYLKAETLFTKLEEIENLAILRYNLGLIFHEQNNEALATSNFQSAKGLFDSLGNRYGVAYCYTSLGDVYRASGAYAKAIDFYNHAYEIHEDLSNKQGMAEAFIQIGLVYFEHGKYPKAGDFYQEAFNLNAQIDYPKGKAIALRNRGHIAVKQEKYREARQKYHSALLIADELADNALLQDLHLDLSGVYNKTQNVEKAFAHYKQYISFRDSIETAELDASMTRLKARYDIDSREKTIENLQVKQNIQEVENRRQRTIIRFSMGVVLIIVLFLALLFRKNREIRNVYEQLVLKQSQIKGSIDYASKIQAAVLPPESIIHKLIPDSFILFKPRDIVSGDFYWIGEREGKVAVAAVDCTGHGVPGAFMSMMGISFLNEVFMKGDFQDAGGLLTLLRSYVKEALHQTEEYPETKDGMDISLVIIDPENHELQFSGAYRPMVLCKGQEEVYLKGDRMPIGIHYNEKDRFSTHRLHYTGGEMIYLFSDGYSDQFGGPSGRKFRLSPFRELLQSVAMLPVASQKAILQHELAKWQGAHEQIDDILVMGLRL
ncbi:MAG: tetratricopeptide repeat protein [Bacteroidales bacterium]